MRRGAGLRGESAQNISPLNLFSQLYIMADRSREIIIELTEIGITEPDALVIADCIITRKSCSWVNTDFVDDKVLMDLNDLVKKNNYRIAIKVDAIPTRSKFIWDIKVL
jgi:hypothetical protein